MSEPRNIDVGLAVIVLLYSLSYFLMAINSGVFWDDYTLYNVDRHTVIETFIENGGLWVGYLHAGLLSLGASGIHVYRVASFLLYLLVVLFCYGILKNVEFIDARSRFCIVLLFALIPVNSARVALINFPAAVCYAAFWAAFYLLVKDFRKFRVPVYGLFLFSFFLNSLLVFYLVVIICHYFVANKKSIHAVDVISYIKKNYILLSMPFVFWIVRNISFKGKGLYQDYNVINAGSLLKAFPKSVLNLYDSVLLVVKESFVVLDQWFFVLLFLALAICVFCFTRKMQFKDAPLKWDALLLGVGLFAFGLGVFPYLVVSKAPQLHDWQSRHQILTPLGSAFLLFYLIKVLQRVTRATPVVTISVVAVLTGAFVCKNLSNGMMFLQDWYKQQSIVINMANDEIVKNCSVVLVKDNTKRMNANGRNYRFYEYSGLMKMAFGDEARLGVDYDRFRGLTEYTKFLKGDYAKRYSLSDFKGDNGVCLVEFSMAASYANISSGVLLLMELFGQEIYAQNVKDFIRYKSGFLRL